MKSKKVLSVHWTITWYWNTFRTERKIRQPPFKAWLSHPLVSGGAILELWSVDITTTDIKFQDFEPYIDNLIFSMTICWMPEFFKTLRILRLIFHSYRTPLALVWELSFIVVHSNAYFDNPLLHLVHSSKPNHKGLWSGLEISSAKPTGSIP